MFIGARTVKTGIAVATSMYFCTLLDIHPAIFAGAATVLNLQPSLGLSLNNAKVQMQVHFTSIALATLLGLIVGTHPLVMGLATILIIVICNHFKWRSGMSGGIMATIFVLSSPPEQFLQQAMMRSLAIFIGVGTALLVNATIAPPRYRHLLIQKLNETNTVISEAFAKAIQDYFQLNVLTDEEFAQQRKKIKKLLRESQRLYELYHKDTNPFFEEGQDKTPLEIRFFSDYITYNKGLWQRTKDIIFLAQERLERRKKAGDLPVSAEFQEILALLQEGLDIYKVNNEKLSQKLLEGNKNVFLPEPHIWRKLDRILNNWHSRFPEGSYYLHALVEVSLITYKIRWAAKESVRLLNYEQLPE